jgi:Phospholipase_D-nuclease N-terminal
MWDSFWDFIWYTLVIFAFFAYLMVLFHILVDLFSYDKKTSGWVKAIWVICLIVFPFITALVYLIARGRGMADRSLEAATDAKRATDAYIRETAGRSAAQDIADAKALLESGTITQQEFEAIKGKALS